MEDGREFTLPLDTLSEADSSYVREFAALSLSGCKLMIHISSDSGKPIRIAVRFALENDPSPAPKLESLDSWGGKVVPR